MSNDSWYCPAIEDGIEHGYAGNIVLPKLMDLLIL